MTRVLQIVPRVPPAVCGVGEYAWNLAGALRSEEQIESLFLAAGTGYLKPEADAAHATRRLEPQTTQSLCQFVRDQSALLQGIIVQLSPYGFAPRGAPVWLARAMRRISRMKPRLRIVTMFHETYASGPWSSSSFWLQPVQKWVIRQIARSSDVVRTNRQSYAATLESAVADQGKKVTIMPVFSNFGEPSSPSKIAGRAAQMIVFSTGVGPGPQANDVRDAAVRLCRRFGLATLHLIGRHWPESESREGVQVMRHAFLPTAGIEALLADSRIGYMAYPPDYLGKSTFFAALAAHGLAVITQGSKPVLPDGLQEGREFLHEQTCLRGEIPSSEQLQAVAAGLREWYSSHDLTRHAGSYARDLRGA